MLKGLYLLNTDAYDKIYGESERAAIAQQLDIYAPLQTQEMIWENPGVLTEAEVIFSGWGMARLDEVFLAAAPRLKVVFYGSGSIRGFATDAAWDRGIIITSAYAANAVPVAEFTLSQILFSLKRGWDYVFAIKRDKVYPPKTFMPGGYQSTVGLISLGMIGRLVVGLLKSFDLHVIAYDPYVSAEQGTALGVEMVALDDVFRRADVVSLHTPWLPETVGMITGAHFAAMKPGATFINTARGAIVREAEMIAVLERRPDVYALLDVTYPEPPEPGSLLYTLPNVVLTPHIAGSMFNECRRMGQYMVDELHRYLAGEPLRWAITRERAKLLA
ncbi:MAG: hydroxyacid dehydrogenase [Anaerolineae bacterium]|nr:hydroxyacid dehydrogenase [Anaerolineae bacterium]